MKQVSVTSWSDDSYNLEQGAVDLSHLPRTARLAAINDILRRYNLRPLEGILDASQQQMEILGINSFTPDPFVSRVDFKMSCGKTDAQGNDITFNHLVFINAQTHDSSGVVIVPILQCENTVEDFILLVRTGRPTMGKLIYELPRGFSDSQDTISSKSLASAVAAAHRELKEETGLSQMIQSSSYIRLKDTYENTGTHNVKNYNVALIMKVTSRQLDSLISSIDHKETESGIGLCIRAVPLSQAFGLLHDNHSITALSCWLSRPLMS